jgi:hypothetical protein
MNQTAILYMLKQACKQMFAEIYSFYIEMNGMRQSIWIM